MSEGAIEGTASALSHALDAVGDRWTLLIVSALIDGPRRFGALQEAVHGIAPNVLAQRLRRLEQEGLVRAEPYSERPPRYVYELAEPARELAGALRLLSDWGARHREEADAPRHPACGTALEVRWYCPTCDRTVDPEATTEDLHYA